MSLVNLQKTSHLFFQSFNCSLRWFLSCSGNGFTVLKRSLIQKYSLYINIGLVIRLVTNPLKTRINAEKRYVNRLVAT